MADQWQDFTGREYLAVCVGAARVPALPVDVREVRLDDTGPASLEAFRAALGQVCVGARVVLAGPRADVWALRAQAFAAGLMPEEVLALVVPAAGGPQDEAFYCVHCGRTGRAPATGDGLVECPGCGRCLQLEREQVSARHGGVLGVVAG